MAIAIAIGKIAISILSAYAVVYFRFPFRMTAFWLIFITLMLPVEVRIYPTYKIVADLGLLDTYAGLILPLIASATGTLLFRQFFMTDPGRTDRGLARSTAPGPFRFFKDTLLPLSITTIAALFVIQFIYGWNQYLWPLLITTKDRCRPSSSASRRCWRRRTRSPNGSSPWRPPCSPCCRRSLVVVVMQKLFVQGPRRDGEVSERDGRRQTLTRCPQGLSPAASRP